MQRGRTCLYRAVVRAMKMSILHRAFCFLIASSFLILVDRLPAPIVEETTPKPASEQSAKAKSKSSPKLKPKSEASTNPVRQQASSKQSRFAGTWVGTMQTFPMGPAAVVLTVDSTETTMAMTWRGSTVTVKAQRNGDTLQATSPEGIYTNTWSLTPQPDGTTARVRMQAFLNDFTAVFHRTVATTHAANPAR
jgi:cytoskeletal protein RodZ